jgi:uncharacterized membrane-anchored protein YitT (DUF2179 family)
MHENNRYIELKNYFYVSLGAVLLAIVIVTFLAPNHSLITVYLSSKGIDVVLSGRAVFKMVHVSTKKAEFLSEKIVKHMNIRGTIIEDKKVILLLIDSNRIIELKNILQKYDEDSFMVIADTSEIVGRGH